MKTGKGSKKNSLIFVSIFFCTPACHAGIIGTIAAISAADNAGDAKRELKNINNKIESSNRRFYIYDSGGLPILIDSKTGDTWQPICSNDYCTERSWKKMIKQ